MTESEIVAVGRGQFIRPAVGMPALADLADRIILTDATGRVLAVAAVRDGRLAPDKVLIDPPVSPGGDPAAEAAPALLSSPT